MEPARHALIEEILERYRRLEDRDVTWSAPHRDYRAGDANDLSVAIAHLELELGRRVPYARELEDADLSDAGLALDMAVHAVNVGDLLSAEDFTYLTAPLSEMLGFDLAARHAGLRAADAPEAGPIIPYDTPAADPLPDHALWTHTRDLLTRHLSEIARRDGSHVYVVDVHFDMEWLDDIRQCGIEIFWNTEADGRSFEWQRFRRSEDFVMWRPDRDGAGHDLLADYAGTLDLWYSDEELEDDEVMDKQSELAEYLEAGLPAVVRALHDGGEIERIFGRPIPVMFSADDSHAPAWEWGRAANPPELYALFGPGQERDWSPG